jgi:ABC-type lipoprotein export system ATPase subunit
MVTHDPRYARYATRTIHLFDGKIVEEESGPERQREEKRLEESGFQVS